jgi:hypothetical protein
LPIALAGCFGEWNKDYETMQRPDTAAVPYEVRTTSQSAAVRELDPKRKVADQDCTKPFDPTLGNLRCR